MLARALVTATVGICAGAAAADWLPTVPILAGLAIGLAIPVIVFRQPAMLLLAVALASAQLGVWRMQSAESELAFATQQISALSGQREIRGLVSDDPVNRGRTTSVRLSDVLARVGEGWQPLASSVLLSVPAWPEHEYGEYLQVRGRLQTLSGSGAVEALRRQGLLASMSYPKVSYLANPQANPLLIAVFRLRQRLGAAIDQTLPEPAASTLKATILGLRSALPKDEQQALVDTGTVHLVAISGFKLSLLAAALEMVALFVLRRTTARLAARLAVSGVVLAAMAGYTVMTGASPSAVRAAIMAGAVLMAALAGRPRDQIAALSLAALAIVLARPFELQDGGLQLSSLSVLGIVLLAEPLSAWIARLTAPLPEVARVPALAFGRAVAVSVAATAFDLPVLAGSFHSVSLVSPLANLLGMPLLWPIMIFGGLGAALGSLAAPLGALLLWPAWAFVTLLDWLIHVSAGLPYAALPIGNTSPVFVAIYYCALLAIAWWLQRGPVQLAPKPVTLARRLTWAAIAAGAVAAACASAIATRPPASLSAAFLAVPGQATLIETPTGVRVLVDGGADGQALLRQLGAILPPWDRSVDAVVLTSTNTDHISGLEALFDRYHIGAFIAPESAQPSATLTRLLQRSQPSRFDQVDLGGGSLLTREASGWRLQSGLESILLHADGSDLQLASGDWRITPLLRGLQPSDTQDVLSLADTGTVTVTFGTRSAVDS